MSAIGNPYGTPVEMVDEVEQKASRPMHVERVRDRLATRTDLDKARQKTYNLRRIIAGDISVVSPNKPAADQEDMPSGDSVRDLYDFIITSYADGNSNGMLKTIRTLVHQVSYTTPDIEFEDLDTLEAAVLSSYCKQILGEAPKGCAANDEMKLALVDFLCGGYGWVKACYREDRPEVMFCDMLDMSWDRTAKTPAHHRWRSCRFREPISTWRSIFPDADFSQWLQGMAEHESELDRVLEVEFYYDVDGGDGRGSFYAFPVSGDRVEPEPLHADLNPYFFIGHDGTEIPFLPYECFYFWLMPSQMSPTGLGEQMLANQMAVWEAETSVKKTVERSKKFYQARTGSLDEKMRKRFERGDIAALIEYNEEGGPIAEGPNLEVSKTLLEWLNYNERKTQEHGAANPYVGGAPQGVDFAREVDEIATQSGQMAGVIAKEYAAFWVRVVRKVLGVAAVYETRPFKCRVDGVLMSFGDGKNPPISEFVYPDADIVIREDKMQFKSRKQKIGEAMELLTISTSPGIAKMFPNAAKLAFETYLRASGEENVAPWLETAPPMAGTGMDQNLAAVDGQVGM